MLGMFVGNFMGVFVADLVGYNDGPFWTGCIGVFFGCLLGIVVPKAILRNSHTMGLNKISHHQQLLGEVTKDELESIILGKDTYLNFMAKKAFIKMDTNESNSVETDEIKEFLQKEQGAEYNEEAALKEIDNVWKSYKSSKNQSSSASDSYSLSEFTDIYKDIAKNMLLEHLNTDDKDKKNAGALNAMMGMDEQDIVLKNIVNERTPPTSLSNSQTNSKTELIANSQTNSKTEISAIKKV